MAEETPPEAKAVTRKATTETAIATSLLAAAEKSEAMRWAAAAATIEAALRALVKVVTMIEAAPSALAAAS